MHILYACKHMIYIQILCSMLLLLRYSGDIITTEVALKRKEQNTRLKSTRIENRRILPLDGGC